MPSSKPTPHVTTKAKLKGFIQGNNEKSDFPDEAVNCKWICEVIEAHVTLSSPLPQDAEIHLRHCQSCREHLMFLGELQVALLEDSPSVTPPEELEEQLLKLSKVRPRRSWRLFKNKNSSIWPALLSSAALIGLLVAGALSDPSRNRAIGLANPAVIVPLTSGFLVANNDPTGTVSIVGSDQKRVIASLRVHTPKQLARLRRPLGNMGTPRPMGLAKNLSMWYGQGTRVGSVVYLTDILNNRILEIQTKPLQLLRVHAMPEGIAGLTHSSDTQGSKVFFKSVRGEVGVLGGQNIAVNNSTMPPLSERIDDILLSGGRLWVTHHLDGSVYIMDPQTLEVEKHVHLGGAPVALAHLDGSDGEIVVLDMRGRLLHLDRKGEILKSWALSGHPDQLAVSGHVAVITDRSGRVTRVDIAADHVRPLSLLNPTFVTRLSNGKFALAEGERGVRVLDKDLNTNWRLPKRR